MSTEGSENVRESKLSQLAILVSGLSNSEWQQLRSAIDYFYEQKAAKVQLGDPKQTQKNLEEFLPNPQQFE